MPKTTSSLRAIETDQFPIDFLSQIAERESWRKEIHRPIYHVHKWWANRLGSVFRGILLGCSLDEGQDVAKEFYRQHSFLSRTVLDPFLGSGTTIGEAHKLGFTALGRDINPVAVQAVRVAFGPLNEGAIELAFRELAAGVGKKLRTLYRSVDGQGRPCDVLYFFWVMQARCTDCGEPVDLFSSYVVAQNAYPLRRPEAHVVCPRCGALFRSRYDATSALCPSCGHAFDPSDGPAKGQKARCQSCQHAFSIKGSVAASGTPPSFRLYAKLVLTEDGAKEYLRATEDDARAYQQCAVELADATHSGRLKLPELALADGHNTRQAIAYNFKSWRDFFNDRQLLALGLLQAAIDGIPDATTRDALRTLFSGVLEFNNLFASYKGEGTGAVRHMFAHHILKPERTPIEANIWGTRKSSGSFSGLYRSRLQRALAYRRAPTEVNGTGTKGGVICSPPFSGRLGPWPTGSQIPVAGSISVSCGDSAATALPDKSVDLVVTDPPFFDNVHYSELADFFYAWQRRADSEEPMGTTRHQKEVQDTDPQRFASKLMAVFVECRRVLMDDGLLVFSYHHSRDDGWKSVAEAILGAGFCVVNSQPIKAEMSVATPKAQAKEPIQFDIILVCRKAGSGRTPPDAEAALAAARSKIQRLQRAGFRLSRNDLKVVCFGQILTTLRSIDALDALPDAVDEQLRAFEGVAQDVKSPPRRSRGAARPHRRACAGPR